MALRRVQRTLGRARRSRAASEVGMPQRYVRDPRPSRITQHVHRLVTLLFVTDPATLTLTASLRPAALDARRGVVRLHREVLSALGLRPGDPVTLTGRRATAGIAAYAEAGASRALLYADDLTLGHLGTRDGGQVTVAAIAARAARTVTLAGPTEIQAVVSPEMLRLALLGKVVTVGDNVSLLPQDVAPAGNVRGLLEAAKRSLSNTIGYGFTSALVTVTGAEPAAATLVTMDTVVAWRDGQATHEPGTVPEPEPATQPAPSLEDLPGLRS